MEGLKITLGLIAFILVFGTAIYYFFIYEGPTLFDTGNCKAQYPDRPGVFGNLDGSCWECPPGLIPNPLNIDPRAADACIATKKAHVYGKIEPALRTCKAIFGNKYFGDPAWTDRCWRCPDSHPARTIFGKVNGDNACGKNITGIGGTTKASFKFVTRKCKQFGKKTGFEPAKRYTLDTRCFGCPNGFRHHLLRDPNDTNACIATNAAKQLQKRAT